MCTPANGLDERLVCVGPSMEAATGYLTGRGPSAACLSAAGRFESEPSLDGQRDFDILWGEALDRKCSFELD